MQDILVTGAAGFIGYHTVKRLIKMGFNVTGIDNLNNYYDPGLKIKRLESCGIRQIIDKTPAPSDLYPGYSFIRLDITDGDGIKELFENNSFDAVIHLAAQPGARYSVDNPELYIDTNISGFLNILEACRHSKPKHLIYASSSSVYGRNDEIPYSEDDRADHQVSLYGVTKKSNELMAYVYSHLYGIPITGLRFFTVYGPWGRPDMVYYKFAESILEEEPIMVFNEGNMQRDFTYVEDIVEGMTDILGIIPEDEVPHRIFNIGHERPVELLYFIEVLENLLNKKATKVMLPMQQGDVLTTYANTEKLKNYCGYKPQTSLEVGLKKFTDWYLKYRNNS